VTGVHICPRNKGELGWSPLVQALVVSPALPGVLGNLKGELVQHLPFTDGETEVQGWKPKVYHEPMTALCCLCLCWRHPDRRAQWLVTSPICSLNS
jgi:hypothetical protein